MSVHGPYHAPHLYKEIDFGNMLQSTDPRVSKILSTYKLVLPLVSSSSGDCTEENLGAPVVLAAVIKDILSKPLKLQDIVAGYTDLVNTSLSPNNSESMLAKALNLGTSAQVTLYINSTAAIISEGLLTINNTLRISIRPKLAIVNIVGRFSNTTNYKKF